MSKITSIQDTQGYKHEHKSNLCYYTNELYDISEIVKYKLSNRGYGSIFDCDTFTIQLNKEVAKELDKEGILKAEWFDNVLMENDNEEEYIKTYKHEYDILHFINNLIVENQEYVLNCDNTLMGQIDREDWIVMRMKELDNQIC